MAEDWQVLGLQEVEEVPQRRRSWARIGPTGTYPAGRSGHKADFRRGMVELARQAGAELDEVGGQESDG